MEGGIALLLLLIIVIAAVVIGAALYLTGGALWFRKTSPQGDKVEGSDQAEGRFDRPEHKRVTSETIENTELAGREERR
ncbi:MAG TPA: hypothetical protein VNS09_20720 [Solirubrobacter sp.]|nr:hypothetical protein [Solirubrobacter sp.]